MYLRYILQVLRHKWFVLQEGRKLSAPLYLLILHDWSKFLPSEFFAYARYFCGSDKDRSNPAVQAAFDKAWLLHQRRNKHHWQYWLLIQDDDPRKSVEMPTSYMLEMIADWRGAGRAYGKNPGTNNDPDTRNWYETRKDKIVLHPRTRLLVEIILGIV